MVRYLKKNSYEEICAFSQSRETGTELLSHWKQKGNDKCLKQ